MKDNIINSSMDLVTPFYNEQDNVMEVHKRHKKLEEIFNIKNYIYVINGSEDDTPRLLKELSRKDPKIKLVHIKENKGYGYGMKQGYKAVESEFIMTNHSDLQFDPYSYFLSHRFENFDNLLALFPKRVGRPKLEVINALIVRFFCSIFLNRKIKDFNGQPKLLKTNYVLSQIDEYPDDFCFELKLFYECGNNSLNLPVIMSRRKYGLSQWNTGYFQMLKILFRYISFAIFKK